MPSSQVQEIKEKLDIVEVVQSYIKLQKAGANYKAPCPFHSEKNPSFFVSSSKQIFKCFGCGAAGSVFDFVMKIEGLGFKDALYILAKRVGVELRQISKQESTQRQRLSEILELACMFFEKQLKASQKGKQAQQYLLGRGISKESIKKWRLGYAPSKWQALSDFLVGKGYDRAEVIKAGLAVKSQKSSRPYDRFRGRVMFPVFGFGDQVLGFGGRVFLPQDKKEIAKYINTPATPLYDKSRTLYGLNFAKVPIRRNNRCILTEGYTDVILCHQAGFEETVAASGTSLTSQQLGILKRYTNNLLTGFDMDRAGSLATKKGIDMAQALDFEVKVIAIPQDQDPAEIIGESKEKWQKLVDEAQDIMEFYFQNAFQSFDKQTAQGKKQIAAAVLPRIALLVNQITRAHWVQRLAQELGVPEQAVTQQLKDLAQPSSFSAQGLTKASQETPAEPQLQPPKSRQQLLEEKVLSLALAAPHILQQINNSLINSFSAPVQTALSVLQEHKIEESSQIKNILNKADLAPEVRQVFTACCLEAEIAPEQDPGQELRVCLRELQQFQIKNQLSALSQKIQQAEQDNNQAQVRKLVRRFNKLTQKIYEYQKQEVSAQP